MYGKEGSIKIRYVNTAYIDYDKSENGPYGRALQMFGIPSKNYFIKFVTIICVGSASDVTSNQRHPLLFYIHSYIFTFNTDWCIEITMIY
jgi:hypothetical protein